MLTFRMNDKQRRWCLVGYASIGTSGIAWVPAGSAAVSSTASAGVEDKSDDEPVETEHLSENENKNHADEELKEDW